ncbi:phosphotransferase family protein [Deinococcus peraridilitoris]|uniref:Putative aminoglycoside phosphotransferase n=1 Tax=Deinococcus peraridilitoris (strain DSM 19664 / LMG 22246 / CIP 109416 / KR-200) TaxID=937777 RepID=K9ZYU1_DEIPD|nr:phosphotransferase family protein [Deinococcus peraridilitoris]AFZ66751.1 putative aminoglycoside phosphotransferase [Deinococcus peraridilitoris DSM 19664]
MTGEGVTGDTAPIRPGEELELDKLREYLRGRLDADVDALTVEQFPGGHSNLTYLVRLGGQEFVLRRAPMGPVAPKAHDMIREYRVLERIHPLFAAAPKVALLCEDAGVLGVPFYLMERRVGVILRDQVPPEYAEMSDLGGQASRALIDGLAQLHAVDIVASGLIDIGKPKGFLTRQVEGWATRWNGSKVEELPDMERVIAWLRDTMPQAQPPTIVHNDYKLDNVMLAPHDPGRIVGVLDWEMTTVGDPLVDLGLSLCYWQQRSGPFGAHGGAGWYSREAFIERYAQQSGRDVTRVAWYEVLGAFKLAVILQQIFYRFHKGQTQDPRFAKLDAEVASLVRVAAQRTRQADAEGV